MIAVERANVPIATPDRRAVIGLSIAGLSLVILLAAFILLYVNFPPGYNAPYGLSLDSLPLFRSLWPYPTLSLEPATFATLAAVVMLLLWGVYLAASLIIRRSEPSGSRRPLLLVVVAVGVLANLMLVLALPPVLSSDIYSYGLYGRMITTYQINPYVATGMTIPADPLVGYTHWRTVSTRYGPVWTLISIPPAAVGSQSVLVTVLAFKVVAATFNLVNGLLVFRLARRLTGGDGVLPLLLYAWNPLILIETAGSGHNDAVMMTFALLGILLVVRERLLLGLAFLTLSAMVKYVTAFLLLFVVVRALARERIYQQWAGLLARMGGVVSTVVAACYLPFVLASDGLQQFLTAAAPLTNSVRNPIHLLLGSALTTALASSGDGQWVRATAEMYLGLGLYAILALLLLLMARAVILQKPDWPQVLERWGIASLVYLVLVYGGNLPWYLISPLTTTFVGPHTRTNLRLNAIVIGLGIIWMLAYARLIPY